ncbi:MAG: VWA domain-containing protein [Gammaproteobacteria bacterium]|nr:VWA domain-containing protein [Gammaproteobacteria bacterium]
MFRLLTDKSLIVNLFFSLLIIGLILVATMANADDIEAYKATPGSSSSGSTSSGGSDVIEPNVLFVLDISGSMGYPGGGGQSRIQNLKDSLVNLLSNDAMKNIDAGIMAYSTYYQRKYGHRPRLDRVSSFKNIGDNKDEMIAKVNSLSDGGGTPTVAALKSAVDVYKGEYKYKFEYGYTNAGSYQRRSIASPVAETSPFKKESTTISCSTNQIILLSDGSPNTNSTNFYPNASSVCVDDPNVGADGKCSKEIAQYARETDFKKSTDWPGQQNILTYTIGFATSGDTEKYLQGIASAGGGKYYPASNSSDLLKAFTAIVSEGKVNVKYTYNAPIIPFNQDNSAVSGDYIYIPLFEPGVNKLWSGNLKKYKFLNTSNGINIVENDGTTSVLNADYTFKSSTDLWASSPDDGSVIKNGAAAKQQNSRNLYSNINTDINKELTDSTNLITLANTLIDNATFGMTSTTDKNDLINWLNWKQPSQGIYKTVKPLSGKMGAPIHTQPVVINYSGGDIILMAGSDGILKAINDSDGTELWGFIPKEFLKDIGSLALNTASDLPYYGIDGPLTYYELNSKKYVVFGMRRGGNAYYALDITDKINPKFAWKIDKSSSGFSQLGQTWSKPLFVKMHIASTDQDVLVFGGGYDADQEDDTTRSADDEGNVIYIVAPETGDLLSSISNTGANLNIAEMTNSIPSDLLPVDINANGIIDRLYASDLGGRIIRIDIPDAKFNDVTLSGDVIADINSEAGADFRRFFNTPEVGYYSKGGEQYIAVLIGSGHRAKPLSTDVIDRFYMIKDYNTWKAPLIDDNTNGVWDNGEIFNYHNVNAYERKVRTDSSGDLVSIENLGELYNATKNLIQDGSSSETSLEKKLLFGQGSIQGTQGWFIDLSESEKVFAKARLYSYAVLFTTYSKDSVQSVNPDPCMAVIPPGQSRFYAINMLDASAIEKNFDGDDTNTQRSDRSFALKIPGIPPTPGLIFGGKHTRATVGLEEVMKWDDRFHAISWEGNIHD